MNTSPACRCDVNAKEYGGSTPLHIASSKGSVETVRELIKHGADVNAKEYGGSTPLHLASSKGSVETVRELIKYGADVNAPLANESYSTPLHLASSAGSAETVRLLIDHGAKVDVKDHEGRTPQKVARSRVETTSKRTAVVPAWWA